MSLTTSWLKDLHQIEITCERIYNGSYFGKDILTLYNPFTCKSISFPYSDKAEDKPLDQALHYFEQHDLQPSFKTYSNYTVRSSVYFEDDHTIIDKLAKLKLI